MQLIYSKVSIIISVKEKISNTIISLWTYISMYLKEGTLNKDNEWLSELCTTVHFGQIDKIGL